MLRGALGVVSGRMRAYATAEHGLRPPVGNGGVAAGAKRVDGDGELGGFVARFPLDGALARCFAVRSARLLVACERRRR